MVIRAMAHNYEQIKTAEVTMEMMIEEDPSNLPTAGRKTAPKRAPRPAFSDTPILGSSRTNKHVIIRGEDVRYEERIGEGASETTIVRKQGNVFHYARNTRQMDIRRADELQRTPIDPREVGTVNASIGLADLLRSSDLLGAEVLNRPGPTSLARVVIRYGPRREPVSFEFDASARFLPTLIVVTRPDGTLKSCLELTYQDILDGKASFLKDAVERFYRPGATKTPTENGWYQRIQHTVTHLRINQPVNDSAFEIHVPDGTVIADTIAKTWHVQGKQSQETRSFSRRLVWYGAGIGLLLSVALLIYVKVRRGSAFH
jgi:hypothetical protein